MASSRSRLRATAPAVTIAAVLGAVALVPAVTRCWASFSARRQLARVQQAAHDRTARALEPELSLRVQQLSPLLSSWESVGGCGAGSTSGTGNVKWIGHGTTGGLFQNITQANFTPLPEGYNLVLTTQFTRDIDDRWNVGVLLPYVYKRFNDYMMLPVDIVNSGLGDINLLGTVRLGEIRETSLTATIGLPTGVHDARYRTDLLTQEKQLGLGKLTASLTLDHTMDEVWGVIVLGGLLSYRGGENELGSFRAPLASVYGYAGYFAGPLVPALGLSFSAFTEADRDRGMEQNVPTVLVSANASLEWSTDWIAVLAGISVPFGLYARSAGLGGRNAAQEATGLQPWTAAVGVSVSPF